MSLRSETRAIAGVLITMRQMPVEKGLEPMARIAACLPRELPKGARGSLVSGLTRESGPSVRDMATMGVDGLYSTVRLLLRKPETIKYLAAVFGEQSQVPNDKGVPVSFTAERQAKVFGADYGALFEFLWFGIELNYTSLAGMLPPEGKAAIAAAVQTQAAQMTGVSESRGV